MYSELTAKLFESLNEKFISDRLLADTLKDARQRALVLVGVLGVSAGSAAILALALGGLYALTRNPLHLVALLVAVITVLGYLATLAHFKRRQKLLPSSNCYGIVTTFSTLGPCALTGGIASSPYVPLVLVVPVFIFLIAGKRLGVYWAFITACCVIALFVLEASGVQFPQIIPEPAIGPFRLTTWLMTLGLLLLGLISYEGDFESLTKRILEERSIYAHQALHDPLTGLPNRKRFMSRAQEAIDRSLSSDEKAAVIFVDLDDFKLINDRFGHATGDEVLGLAARRLQANVRSVDTVARLGGDEFAIVLYDIETVEAAELVVKKLRAALYAPYEIRGNTLRATGSIGLAIAPDQGCDVDRLLREADDAMYRAKEFRIRSLVN